MTILENIIQHKRKEVEERKDARPIKELEKENNFKRKTHSLKDNILNKELTGIIAEFKRRSPSKGMINESADAEYITKGYASNGASALSVLTDTHFFGGTFDDLKKARENRIPILQKDFIIEEYQVFEAKSLGADAILLIAACLTPKNVKNLASVAQSLGMEVLLELHNEKELDHICDETAIIGINNRNLKDFLVDLENSFRMSEKIPAGKVRIAESGINSHHIIKVFKENGFDGFLIGEHFMKEKDPVVAFIKFAQGLKAE